jgi:y4mF family transcriptional regulator
MTELADVGRKVRDRRKSLGLTQDDLADLARCPPRFVPGLEAGKPSVRLDKLRDVLDVLGLELDVTPRRTSLGRPASKGSPRSGSQTSTKPDGGQPRSVAGPTVSSSRTRPTTWAAADLRPPRRCRQLISR